ncbi:LysR family transcriptional regulator [Croceicoccus marinus]|uniref:LysR family transcriptional regulator n=1 Tax=Croceicoccus marinus TaxID=450378 RepID=A0A7G6VQH4_9SPHN|nr:LysR family transcriptional regulator [Croceicoccus marinus]QNE03989.1 LysR family transcriptional regulator [Croceicoccus marinus]
MQDIDWSDFQVFLALAQSGRTGDAANLLGVDATTVSRRLKRLETGLAVALFERSRDGHQLTEAGEELLEQVSTMARAAAKIRDGAEAGEGLSGTLRISVSEGFGSWFLARHIPDLADAHPALTIDLVASSGFLNPSRREADIAVMLSRPRSGQLIARKLSDYALSLYATQDYLDRAGTPQRSEDLITGHRLIGYVPELVYAPELVYLDEIHPGLRATLRSSSINAQHRLIARGAGLGVLPRFIGDADPALVPLLPQRSILRSFWIVTHADTNSLARVRAGTEWLIDVVAKHRSVLLPR